MATIETKLLSAAEKLTKAVNALTREIKETKAAPPEPAPAITWQDAVRVVKAACSGAEDCAKDKCPLWAWCDAALGNEPSTLPPADWPDPDEVGRK